MSTPGSPAVIQPAIARPMPPPPPNPLSDSPAATQNPRTPGQRPEQRVGVGRHRVRVADEPDRLGVGEEREAADRAVHQRREPLVVRRQRACAAWSHGTPSSQRDTGSGLVAAEDHPAVLALAVDEVVRVAEARHVARAARDPGTARSAMCWWSTGVDGMNAPTIAATCGAHIPAALTTISVSIGPASVSTRRISRRGRQLEPGHPDARPDPDAERPGRVRDRVGGARAGRGGRHRGGAPRRTATSGEIAGIRRRASAAPMTPDVEADAAGAAGRPLELAELLRAATPGAGSRRASNTPEALVQLDAVASEAPSSWPTG